MTTVRRFCLIGMPCWTPFQPFYALALIKGLIREEGHEARLYDINRAFYQHVAERDHDCWSGARNHLWCSPAFCHDLYEKYLAFFTRQLDELSALFPDMYAFSVNWWNRYMTVRFARELKRRRPEIPILFGGVDCFPREVGTGFLEKDYAGSCDIVCLGEGEIAMRYFVRSFAGSGRIATQVPGFAWYEKDKIVSTGEPELPTLRGDTVWADFDDYFTRAGKSTSSLPPDANSVSLGFLQAPHTVPFFLSKGCIYRCHFCSERPNFHHFRSRHMKEAVDELEHILRTWCGDTVPYFDMADSNFNADIRQLKGFVDEVRRRRLKFTWGGQGHFEPSLTDEFLAELYQSGLRGVSWGFESGSQHVVDLMNKKYKLSEAERIIRRCNELGIRSTLNLIVGYPGETPEDLIETIRFIYAHQPYAYFNTPGALVVRPNSALHDRPAEHGLADNAYYTWKTSDGSNTIGVRVLRRFILNQVVNNDTLSMNTLVDNEEIAHVEFKEKSVFNELYKLFLLSKSVNDIRGIEFIKDIVSDSLDKKIKFILYLLKEIKKSNL